ncbi:MAG: ADP-ribosylglycohydrolase family protein [Cardiobacteriaceae bacterium]|nr:ADP-ribosylglycohydrolase family protein [Cardiobacteriaceae bacterium]
MLLGAAIGDIIGSRFEFNNYRQTDFDLFTPESRFTDDTVCTVAIAEWVLHGCHDDLVSIMQRWCRRYMGCGFGDNFMRWALNDDPQPYNSYGNGAAMRVSPVGWAFSTLDDTLSYATASAAITHNHPEGIKGAQATAAAIYLARNGSDKEAIKNKITDYFAYDLEKNCDTIRLDYEFNESCQGTVPQAVTAFLESHDFEHAMRLAVSLGGDSDTLAAITGSIAEAYYSEIPTSIQAQAIERLPAEMLDVLSLLPQA